MAISMGKVMRTMDFWVFDCAWFLTKSNDAAGNECTGSDLDKNTLPWGLRIPTGTPAKMLQVSKNTICHTSISAKDSVQQKLQVAQR